MKAPVKFLLAVVVVTALIAAALFTWKNYLSPAPQGDARQHYQQHLDKVVNRFDPHFYVRVIDGQLWADKLPLLGHCEYRCGSYEQGKISLPVGYVHGNDSGVTPAPNKAAMEPINELTFWNPVKQQVETIQREPGHASIALPDFLKSYRKAADLKVGETGYTPPDFMRIGPNGDYWLVDGLIAYENLGQQYRQSFEAAVTRVSDTAYEVTMPPGKKPILDNNPNSNQPPGVALVPIAVLR